MQEQTVENATVTDDCVIEVPGGVVVDGVFFELTMEEVDAALHADPDKEEHVSFEEVQAWITERVLQRERSKHAGSNYTR